MSNPGPPDKAEIQRRHADLMREDRRLRAEALKAVSAQTRPFFQALRDACAESGHEWHFHHWNWDGSCAWDQCRWCSAQEPADQHQTETTEPA